MSDEARETELAAEVSHADLTRPNIARMYDYILGGSANFEVDRSAAEQALELVPTERDYSFTNRSFLGRAVRHLVTEAGIEQFLDLGSGVPTVGNVHEIARAHCPQAKVAYVDWEPIACHHARHLLGEDPQTSVTELDVCDAEGVLHSPGVAGLLDFSQPVAVLAFGILDLVPDTDGAALVERYRDACVAGSALAVSHNAQMSRTDAEVAALRSLLSTTSTPHLHIRTADEVTALFPGYALIDPGVVPAAHWRPEVPVSDEDAARANVLGGVGILRG
ncbi:SAM-dependent methyltransferase [Saccharopolyspora tripterygii]